MIDYGWDYLENFTPVYLILDVCHLFTVSQSVFLPSISPGLSVLVLLFFPFYRDMRSTWGRPSHSWGTHGSPDACWGKGLELVGLSAQVLVLVTPGEWGHVVCSNQWLYQACSWWSLQTLGTEKWCLPPLCGPNHIPKPLIEQNPWSQIWLWGDNSVLISTGISHHLGFPCPHVGTTSHSSVSFTRGLSADSKSGYEERILLVHLGEPMKCQCFCAAVYGTAIHRPVEWRLSRPGGEFRFNFTSKQPSFPINLLHTYWVPGRHPSTFSK